jgi:hypothetical protein
VFHTYSTYGRGAEELLGALMILDRAPLGRNESGNMGLDATSRRIRGRRAGQGLPRRTRPSLGVRHAVLRAGTAGSADRGLGARPAGPAGRLAGGDRRRRLGRRLAVLVPQHLEHYRQRAHAHDRTVLAEIVAAPLCSGGPS